MWWFLFSPVQLSICTYIVHGIIALLIVLFNTLRLVTSTLFVPGSCFSINKNSVTLLGVPFPKMRTAMTSRFLRFKSFVSVVMYVKPTAVWSAPIIINNLYMIASGATYSLSLWYSLPLRSTCKSSRYFKRFNAIRELFLGNRFSTYLCNSSIVRQTDKRNVLWSLIPRHSTFWALETYETVRCVNA